MAADTDEPEIVTLSSKVVYRNRWMTVREDAIRRRDGSDGIYGVVEKADFVVVLAIEPDGSVHLVEQYRYPVGQRFWELPQGAWEDRPGADMLEVARGELREETGLVAGAMTYVGDLLESYGFAHQRCHVFIARDLTQAAVTLEPEELGLISRCVPFETMRAMMRDGGIKDMSTISAVMLCELKGFLERSGTVV